MVSTPENHDFPTSFGWSKAKKEEVKIAGISGFGNSPKSVWQTITAGISPIVPAKLQLIKGRRHDARVDQ